MTNSSITDMPLAEGDVDLIINNVKRRGALDALYGAANEAKFSGTVVSCNHPDWQLMDGEIIDNYRFAGRYLGEPLKNVLRAFVALEAAHLLAGPEAPYVLSATFNPGGVRVLLSDKRVYGKYSNVYESVERPACVALEV